jgi:hypothetical protein
MPYVCILHALYGRVVELLIIRSRLRNLCFSPDSDKWCASSPKGPDHFWSPPSLLLYANAGLLPHHPTANKAAGGESEADHGSSSIAVVKNEWISTTTPPTPTPHMSSVRVYRLRLFTVLHEGYALRVLGGNGFLFINSPLLRFDLPLFPRLCARSMRPCWPMLLLSPHYPK